MSLTEQVRKQQEETVQVKDSTKGERGPLGLQTLFQGALISGER